MPGFDDQGFEFSLLVKANRFVTREDHKSCAFGQGPWRGECWGVKLLEWGPPQQSGWQETFPLLAL